MPTTSTCFVCGTEIVPGDNGDDIDLCATHAVLMYRAQRDALREELNGVRESLEAERLAVRRWIKLWQQQGEDVKQWMARALNAEQERDELFKHTQSIPPALEAVVGREILDGVLANRAGVIVAVNERGDVYVSLRDERFGPDPEREAKILNAIRAALEGRAELREDERGLSE